MFAGGCAGRGETGSEVFTLTADDGVAIQGRLYAPDAVAPPGLMLVHGRGGSSDRWEALARRALQAGYLVGAVELRGHGASASPPEAPEGFRAFNAATWQGAHLDIRALEALLISRGADPENLYIAGEGLGASLALQYAAEHPMLQGAVLLSIGLEEEGIAAEPLVAALADRPLLLIWSEGDAHGAAAGNVLKQVAPGLVEVRTYAGSAHGTDIFATSEVAIEQVVRWLDQMGKPAEGDPESPKS